MSAALRVIGVVLAAGASTRAGQAKALATLDGEALVKRACRLLRDAGVDDVIVVVGLPHGDAVARFCQARVVQNPEPSRGMLSSLRLGLELAQSLSADAMFVALVDHPRVRPDTARALYAEWRRSRAPLVRPRHAGRRGHPYLIDAKFSSQLLALRDEESPRPLFDAVSGAVELDVDDPGVLEDLDTATDLDAAGVQPALS